MKIKEQEIIAAHTHFRIGGPARFFVEPKNIEDILVALNFAEEKKLRWTVISGGSNVLVADQGYDGVFIKMRLKNISIDGDVINAESGVPMATVVAQSHSKGLSGMEWAIGIPGMVGGSIRGNAGCFGGDMSNHVKEVKIYDTKKKTFNILTNRQCAFSYRESIFKRHPELIIISAKFLLTKDKGDARPQMLTFVSERNQSQAIGEQSAGCIFKNPEGLSAGKIIEEAKLKNLEVGGAKVSHQHANFILNNNNATAENVLMLIKKIKQKIKKEKNILLQEEIEYVV